MSDKMITVATYAQTFEAELAQNLLEREGITGVLNGDAATSALFGAAGNILLQVPEADAQRAAGVLASCAAEATLDANWEEKAESGQDVWVCSICGEPVSNRLSTCYSCATPRESIRASRPVQTTDVRTDLPGEIQHTPAAAPTAPRRAQPMPESEAGPREEVAAGDEGERLTRRALTGSLFALPVVNILLTVVLGYRVIFPWIFIALVLLLVWYNVLQVLSYSGELSPAGHRRFFWAVVLACLGSSVLVLPVLLLAGLFLR